VKRCGKSAPRVRQRNRQGKPHREQDRIGMATRVVRESDNARGSDVRLAIRVGCSRQRASVVPEEWPSRLVRRFAGGALQNPAYRPADVYHGGFGVTRRTPRPFQRYSLPCRRHILALLLEARPARPVKGNVLNRALPCIRVAIALTAIAVAACGCAGGNNATSSQASAQGEQPYKTMYGITSEGTTTDLYTEMFGPRQAPAPATNVATAQPVQSVATQSVTSQPIAPVQQNATAAGPAHAGQAAAAASANRHGQTTASSRAPQPAYGQPPAAQPAPVQVAQQPAPPPEPDVPTAYGITANGPTTDLYTAIFGPRRSDGQ
jgi:hypothetical protein